MKYDLPSTPHEDKIAAQLQISFEGILMKALILAFASLSLVLAGSTSLAGQKSDKTYKHASDYQVAVLDQNLRVSTGSDATIGKNSTDAKLSGGGQGIHLLHTDSGDYRVEAPVNKGLSILSAMGSNAYHPPVTYHNKWFLDNVQAGTKVLFASSCVKPSRKHPNDAVRCSFWFPDPDSTSHEYETIGDFTPYQAGDNSNAQKTANTLCGSGKLNAQTEAEICPQKAADLTQASPNTTPNPTMQASSDTAPTLPSSPATQVAPAGPTAAGSATSPVKSAVPTPNP